MPAKTNKPLKDPEGIRLLALATACMNEITFGLGARQVLAGWDEGNKSNFSYVVCEVEGIPYEITIRRRTRELTESEKANVSEPVDDAHRESGRDGRMCPGVTETRLRQIGVGWLKEDPNATVEDIDRMLGKMKASGTLTACKYHPDLWIVSEKGRKEFGR